MDLASENFLQKGLFDFDAKTRVFWSHSCKGDALAA